MKKVPQISYLQIQGYHLQQKAIYFFAHYFNATLKLKTNLLHRLQKSKKQSPTSLQKFYFCFNKLKSKL